MLLSSSSSLSPDTKKLKDIYCRKPFNKDLYIQNAYEHCTKTDLASLLENLRNDKIQIENEIKKCLIHNFNNIVHVNGEGHDFIQRNDRHNRNGKYHSRVTSFGMINTDTKDHDDIDIDRDIRRARGRRITQNFISFSIAAALLSAIVYQLNGGAAQQYD